MIRVVFGTPVDRSFTNAQCINGREIAARLSPETFHLTLFHYGEVDSRLLNRPNVRLIHLRKHGNAVRMAHAIAIGQDVFFNIGVGLAEEVLRPWVYWAGRPRTIFQIETFLPVPAWMGVERVYLRRGEQWIRRATRVTGVSKTIVNYLRGAAGRPDAKCVPVGIDYKQIQKHSIDRERSRLVVLSVGSLKVGKRPEIVLEAARRHPDVEFRIVGEGPLRGKLRDLASQQELRNVSLLGALPLDSVLCEMAKAHIFFFPSIHEGLPRAVLEAAASGLPVVCRNDYGPEGVIDGVTGFAKGTDEELFACLDLLIREDRLRQELGEAGKQHAAQFDWTRIVPLWERIFSETAT